jgi:hypothetical protein
VAHAYNLNYSGYRDQEDRGLKLAPGKWFLRPYLEKNPSQKKVGGATQAVKAPAYQV